MFVIAQESVELDVEGRSNGGRACKKQDEKTFHECLKKGKNKINLTPSWRKINSIQVNILPKPRSRFGGGPAI